jgi:hypothetical protein
MLSVQEVQKQQEKDRYLAQAFETFVDMHLIWVIYKWWI